MPTKTYAGVEVPVDDEGYLTDSSRWNREVGQAIAEELGLELTDEHWKLIDFARSDYAERGQTPGLRRMAANTGVGMKDIYRLFPKGPGKLIAKVAGVPKPKSCI
ncbi:MAG: TusE/DsrC/DsvC family sulfur relay protein [Planctomycetota bacterium]|nr:MAG: TusE/DsrC/DsvC family sulfur relay protein [Planctomycetota bacterium]